MVQWLLGYEIEGNEWRVSAAILAVLVLGATLFFRPAAADSLPLGAAPTVMTQPAPVVEPDYDPRLQLSLDTKDETGPWVRLGANAPAAATMVKPAPGQPSGSWTQIGQRCSRDDPWATPVCYVLPTTNGEQPEHVVYTLGNSHTIQLTAALLEVVDRRSNWALRAQATPACPFAWRENPGSDCEHMWSAGTRYILDQQPDLVVVMATRSSADGPENELAGLADWVAMIRAQTTSQVVVVRDSPRFGFNMHQCGADRGTDNPDCAVWEDVSPNNEQRKRLEDAGAIYLDFNQFICPNSTCRPVIGGVWTYMDDNHMTAEFWRTLSQQFSLRLSAHLDWWPKRPYIGELLDRPKVSVPPVV